MHQDNGITPWCFPASLFPSLSSTPAASADGGTLSPSFSLGTSRRSKNRTRTGELIVIWHMVLQKFFSSDPSPAAAAGGWCSRLLFSPVRVSMNLGFSTWQMLFSTLQGPVVNKTRVVDCFIFIPCSPSKHAVGVSQICCWYDFLLAVCAHERVNAPPDKHVTTINTRRR